MQSTSGQSQPSVSNIELQITLYLLSLKSLRICSRSSEFPFTSAALNPWFIKMFLNFCEVAINGRNTTVFLSLQTVSISVAICSRYGSSAVPISFAEKSPAVTDTLFMSILSGTVCALILHKYPSLIACTIEYSYASDWNRLPNLRISERSGVAVTPNTLAWSKCSRTCV